jgi:RecJ-like exonuclease
MAEIYANNTPIFADELKKKHYLNLWVKVAGEIQNIDVHVNYTEFNFNDEDGISICANFDNPINNEVSLLDKGMMIEVIGQVFNVAEQLVVLDHCQLVSVANNKKEQPIIKKEDNIEMHKKLVRTKWWRKPWIQAIKFFDLLIGIAVKIISIFPSK